MQVWKLFINRPFSAEYELSFLAQNENEKWSLFLAQNENKYFKREHFHVQIWIWSACAVEIKVDQGRGGGMQSTLVVSI